MNLGLSVSRLRCALTWVAATVLTAAVTAGVVPVLRGPRSDFDDVLVWGSATVAVAVTGWLWLVATVVAVDAARGLPRSRPGVPEGLRRALLVLCGVALTTGLASPALASGGAAPGPEVLTGLRLPERVGVQHAPAARPAPPPTVQATAQPLVQPIGQIAVMPGDTLWSLTAERLRPHATPAEIAAAWPRLYAANRDVIGPDPAHIEPGQHLTYPTEGVDHDAH